MELRKTQLIQKVDCRIGSLENRRLQLSAWSGR